MKFLAVAALRLCRCSGFAHGAQAQQAGKLFFEGDMERGNQQGRPPACVLNNQFLHLEKVVWRMRVLDANGKPLDDKEISRAWSCELHDGQKMPARVRRASAAQPDRQFLGGGLDRSEPTTRPAPLTTR